MPYGIVRLVGAGPGDAQLLTLKAKRHLEQADVIVYDRLISSRLLRFAKPNATLISVGKEPGRHSVHQEDICDLLIDHAKRGHDVVRLKGGDPFVFGRGGEEAQALRREGITCEIIPGISSAIAVPAYAGIPVTHRDVSPSFTVSTGHRSLAADVSLCGQNMQRLQHPEPGTLVVLMGLSNLEQITSQLIHDGLDAKTPAAVIRAGTTAAQEVITGTLHTIALQVRNAKFRSPAILVVGEVVNLRRELTWFENLPLLGHKLFVVGDTREQSAKYADHFEDFGAETLDLSVSDHIQVDKRKLEYLAQKLALDNYPSTETRGVYFTTRLGIELFMHYWINSGRDIRSLHRVQFFIQDQALAMQLRQYGIIPSEDTADCTLWIEMPRSSQTTSLPLTQSLACCEAVSLYELAVTDLPAHEIESFATNTEQAVWITSELAWLLWTRLQMQHKESLHCQDVFLLPELTHLAELIKQQGVTVHMARDAKDIADHLLSALQTG